MSSEEAAASCAGIWMRAPALSPHCNLSNAYSSAMPGRPSHSEGHPLRGSAATGALVLCAPNENRNAEQIFFCITALHYFSILLVDPCSSRRRTDDLSNVTQLKQIAG